MRERVTFNGVTISDFFEVAGVTRPLVGRVNTTTEVSGMDGNRITGSVMMPNRLIVSFVMGERDSTERREAVRNLTSMLHTTELAPLMFASDNGLYYMAILDGEVPIQEHVRSGIVEVNFVTESPALYGETRTVTVPSGGSVRIYVDGVYVTYPKISGSVNGSSSASYQWGLRLDERDYMRMVTGSTSARLVTMDCEKRLATLSGAVKLPTLTSDWFELSPGFHTIRNDIGSGASTVTWQERWL